MSMSRKLGILVFFMVPAIIGGGAIYVVFDNYVSVFVYESLLLIFAGGFFSK